ncbi:MAG: galactokinase [Anaerolineaceae bacterium]|nr:galactokinase [Anaerolineaceae bacterium]
MDYPQLAKVRFHVTAPGRVNLLGEHVDYNDGPVLPAAIDRAVYLSAALRPDTHLQLTAQDLGQQAVLDLTALADKRDADGRPLPDWALYPAGVAMALHARGYATPGLDVVYTSNVPMGAGLSSSAAVETAFAVLWQAAAGWEMERMALARICQEAENRYVGVKCGLMDQFASAHGVEGHALFFDTRSLDWHPVPLPPDTAIVIADSGVRRSLTGSAYNQRRAACSQAVELLRPYLRGIRALRDVSPADFDRLAFHLPPLVQQRARHVVEECQRVDQAVELLEQGDAAGFGRLMLAGHASLRDLYEVSVPELDALVEIARKLPGCYGARLTGAGFGGCTVNLVQEEAAPAFIRALGVAYTDHTGRLAEIYLCHASPGARAVTVA